MHSRALLLISTSLIVCADVARSDDIKHKIDKTHSSVMFKVRLGGTGYFYGRFKDVSGSFVIDDGEDPSTIELDVKIKASSVDYNNKGIEKGLRSEAYVNTKKFKTISFKTTRAKKLAKHKFELTGMRQFEIPDGPNKGTKGGSVAGETTFTIKRSDYRPVRLEGGGVADEVTLIVSLWGRFRSSPNQSASVHSMELQMNVDGGVE